MINESAPSVGNVKTKVGSILENVKAKPQEPYLTAFFQYLSGPDPRNLPKTGIRLDSIGNLFVFNANHISFDSKIGDFKLDLSLEERKALQALLESNRTAENEYFRGVFEKSSSLQEMMKTLSYLCTPQKKGDGTPYSYQQAEMMARGDLEQVYGSNFELRIKSDPNVRRIYQRQIQKYESSTNPFETSGRALTVCEVVPVLNGAIASQKKALLKDCITEGAKICYYEVDKNNVKSLKILTQEDLDNFIFNNSTQFEGVLNGRHPNLESLKTSLKLELSGITTVSPQMIKHFMEMRMREEMIHVFELARFELMTGSAGDNISNIGIGTLPYDRYQQYHTIIGAGKQHLSSWKEFIKLSWSQYFQDIYKGISLRPSSLMNKSTIDPLSNSISGENICDFIKMSWLRRLNQPISKERLPFIIGKEKTGLFDTIEAALRGKSTNPQLIEQLKHRGKMSHEEGEVSPVVARLKEVMIDAIRMYIQPDFIISGNPWRHMRALQEIHELSTYTKDGASEFFDYKMPSNVVNNNQLVVSSRASIEAGRDWDGKDASKLFLPEFSKLESLLVFDESGKNLLSPNAYTVQYEEKSGHYRIVWSDAAKVLFDSWPPAIRYRAGIDPDSKQDGSPQLVRFFPISDMPKLSQFASRLRKNGYSKIAEELEVAIIKSEKTGKPITSQDLERAVKVGARYAFKIPDDTRMDEAFSASDQEFAYLPGADESGYATVQCVHAAKLLSDLLAETTPEGSFYPSNMMNTANLGIGVVLAGLLHSDTRGRNSTTHTRIVHDSTPDIKPKSLSELLGKKNGANKEKSMGDEAAFAQDDTVITKEMQQVVDTMKFYEMCATSYTRFEEAIKLLTPVNPKTMRVSHSFHYPEAVTEVGGILGSLQELQAEILENPLKRGEILERLAKARSTWSLAKIATPDVQLQKSKEHLFGIFSTHSEIFDNAINEVEKAIKKINEPY